MSLGLILVPMSKRACRRPGQQFDTDLNIVRHTVRQRAATVWGAVSFDSRTPILDTMLSLKHEGTSTIFHASFFALLFKVPRAYISAE